jgi:hypothetical protein
MIDIPSGAMRIAARETRTGARITYPRVPGLIVSLVVMAAGAAAWWAVLEPDPWTEPMTYALALLLLAPGAWGLHRSLQPRPLIRLTKTELIVRWGPALLERVVARLPAEDLEIRTGRDEIDVIRYEGGEALRATLASAVMPYKRKVSPTRAGLYLLQVRNAGQAEWLNVIGSPVRSEVENARITLMHAGGLADRAPAGIVRDGEHDGEADAPPDAESAIESDTDADAAGKPSAEGTAPRESEE